MSLRLRVLGRVALFAVLVLGVFPVTGRGLHSSLKGAGEAAVYLLDHLVQLAAILLFAWIASRLERRPFGTYGLPWRRALRSGFWKGAAAGLASLSLLVLALSAAGALRLSVAPQRLLVGAGFGLAYAAIFLLLAVREEFLYRGYALFTFTEGTGFWPAAVLTTVWFTWSHVGNRGETPLGLASVVLFGLIACLTLRRTGTLWIAIGYHAAWDWGQTYLYGVADSGHAAPPGHLFAATVPPAAPTWLSGGTVGPEGSVLCLGLFVLTGLACARFLRGGRYPA
jgi:CAAX protease family protein